MTQRFPEIQIFDEDAILQAAFTAAVTDIITSNAHGFKGGEQIQATTSGTLPDGLSLLTNYYVRDVNTNTFKLAATPDGTPIDIIDTGSGTHTLHVKGKTILVDDFRPLIISLAGVSTAVFTLKVQGSVQDEAGDAGLIDFANAQAGDNRWDNIEIVDLEDGSIIDGDTGVAFSADGNRLIEVNTNHLRWLTLNITAFTTGKLGAYIKLADNN